jgi:hypothetical protein
VYYLRFLNIITPCGVVQTYWKHDLLALNLMETRLSINDCLQLKDSENDESFWLYVVKPTYRLQLERATEKCRYNDKYKKALFEKIQLLTDALRSDRDLYRRRKETGKRVRK